MNSNLTDIEGEYFLQMQKPTTFFQYQGPIKKAQTTTQKGPVGDKATYFVRIPIVNPLSSHTQRHYPIQMYFYFRSYKPQDFWHNRGTEIHLDKFM